MQRWGGDCYAFCMLALGCVDLVVEGMLMPYDIVPLIPIIEGAGGVVTDVKGGGRWAAGWSSRRRTRSCTPRRWSIMGQD
jgi:fructose-1,6-bisphosphatase/inositol monophosphatase family enzyme